MIKTRTYIITITALVVLFVCYLFLFQNQSKVSSENFSPDDPNFVLAQNRESINDEISKSRRNISPNFFSL